MHGIIELVEAIRANRPERVRYILSYKPSSARLVNDRTVHGSTPLHLAVSVTLARPEIVNMLVNEFGAPVDATDEASRTPLHVACIEGRLEMVKTLVYLGANVNERCASDGNTALLFAIQKQREPVVKFLLEQTEPNLLLQNHRGQKALDSELVTRLASPERIEKLLRKLQKYPRSKIPTAATKVKPDQAQHGRDSPATKEYNIVKAQETLPLARELLLEKEKAKGSQQSGSPLATTLNPFDVFAQHIVQDLECIGKGSTGEVWKVRIRTGIGASVAARKVISLRYRRLFEIAQKELSILKSLDHPNIIKLIYGDAVAGKMVLFMELLDCSLKDWLQRMRTYGKQDKIILNMVPILLSIARGLYYLHVSKNIIHRDLKPLNCLLEPSKDAEVKRVVLTDFGSSRELLSSSSLAESYCGSPAFMAPELYRRYPYTFSADIYSLGLFIADISGTFDTTNTYPHRRASDGTFILPKLEQIYYQLEVYLPIRIAQELAELYADCCSGRSFDNPYARPSISNVVYRLEHVLSQMVSSK